MPDVDIMQRYRCSICSDTLDVVDRVPVTIGYGGQRREGAPPRWRIINNHWVCSKHTIRYVIDEGQQSIDEPGVTREQLEGRG